MRKFSEEQMASLQSTAFVLGIQHLDVSSRALVDRPEQSRIGHVGYTGAFVDNGTLRLVGAELGMEDHVADKAA